MLLAGFKAGVCVREREGGREREGKRKRKGERIGMGRSRQDSY